MLEGPLMARSGRSANCSRSISATLGLMHCGKSTPRDHLIGMRGKFCASAISTRRWRYFFLDARVEEARAYDRVERAECGARHEANAQ